MNKTCTNPACRRTFSTLNFFGACPFCRKSYPQLSGTRKLLRSENVHVMQINGRRVQIDIAEILRHWRCGRNIVAMIKLKQVIERAGYHIELTDVRDLAFAVADRGYLRSVWEADEASRLILRSKL